MKDIKIIYSSQAHMQYASNIKFIHRATDKSFYRFHELLNFLQKNELKLKKPSHENELQKEKTNYDRSSDRFNDPSLMALMFLERYLMVYKPVNARGARSLNIFP